MDEQKRSSYEVALKVPFFDLDPLQIVWHGNYLKYFDIARSELFTSLGVDLFEYHDRTRTIFPIIRTNVKHIHPLRRDDEFICRATVKDARSKIVVAFEIRLAGNGRLCARQRNRPPSDAGDGDGVHDSDEIRRALGSEMHVLSAGPDAGFGGSPPGRIFWMRSPSFRWRTAIRDGISWSAFPAAQADRSRTRLTGNCCWRRGTPATLPHSFSGLLLAGSLPELGGAVRQGRDRARQAVNDPKPGTMLTVIDALAEVLEEGAAAFDGPWHERILRRLEEAVLSTPDLLPKLKAARVVDAGALGLFIYLDGFFGRLAGDGKEFRSVTEVFRGYLKVAQTFSTEEETGSCVDTVLKVDRKDGEDLRGLAALGESVVTLRDGDYLKVHLHRQPKGGEVWLLSEGDPVVCDTWGLRSFLSPTAGPPGHPRRDGRRGFDQPRATADLATILDSYITAPCRKPILSEELWLCAADPKSPAQALLSSATNITGAS